MSIMTTSIPSASFIPALNLSTLPPGVTNADPALGPVTSCRTRHTYFHPTLFNIISCAYCFSYVYIDADVRFNHSTLSLTAGPSIPGLEGTSAVPIISDEKAVKTVCSFLGPEEDCLKWKHCCVRAAECCQQQLKDEPPTPGGADGQQSCPRTWDGYHCFKDTPANSKIYFNCPAYIPHADTDEKAFKVCEENGTWYRHPESKNEWTDYENCHDLSLFKNLHSAGVACNVITIALLVPACFIFLYFQQLRKQHRIRLHICLMISCLFNSLSMLLWEVILFRDSLYIDGESVIETNSVPCRILNMATRYTLTCNFSWMFIEGFHLHRLLVHAFSAPKSLIPYYALGFGFPSLLIIAYSIIRGVDDDWNRKCWVDQILPLDWILYTPLLFVLLANIFFLIRIVYIMVKQLEPHPNEPSQFRRAAKAVGVLVPLFGLQYILFVYTPTDGTFADVYKLFSKIISSLQGTFIALVFCFFNKEVQTQIKAWLRRFANQRSYNTSLFQGSFSSTYHTETTRTRPTNGGDYGDSSQMIPLQRVGWQEEDANGTKTDHQNQSSSLLGINKTETTSPSNGGPTNLSLKSNEAGFPESPSPGGAPDLSSSELATKSLLLADTDLK